MTPRPKRIKSLVGKKFGRLEVIEMAGRDHHNKVLWKCKCTCELNSIIFITGARIKRGNTSSCGCIKSPPPKEYQEILRKKLMENSYEKNGCRLWKGPFRKNFPYGVVSCTYKNRKAQHQAHRIAYWLWKGEIPNGLFVLHQCDVPQCINPEHLHLGTQKDNVREMIEKGRNNDEPKGKKGSLHNKAKLMEEDIPKIREMKAKGMKNMAIAKIFNVSDALISQICLGRFWKHVE